MTRKTKAHLHKHARRRSVERFGVHLDRLVLRELNSRIRNAGKHQQTVKIIGKQTLTRTRFDVFVKEKWLPIVYDTKRHAIVTVLPERELGNLCQLQEFPA